MPRKIVKTLDQRAADPWPYESSPQRFTAEGAEGLIRNRFRSPIPHLCPLSSANHCALCGATLLELRGLRSNKRPRPFPRAAHPSSDLQRMQFVEGRQLTHRLQPQHRLQRHSNLERRFQSSARTSHHHQPSGNQARLPRWSPVSAPIPIEPHRPQHGVHFRPHPSIPTPPQKSHSMTKFQTVRGCGHIPPHLVRRDGIRLACETSDSVGCVDGDRGGLQGWRSGRTSAIGRRRRSMDVRVRLTFFCGSCLGLAVGFAAGHVSVWDRFDSIKSVAMPLDDSSGTRDSVSRGSTGFDLPTVLHEPVVSARTPVPGGAIVLNDPDLGDEPVHADALVEMPPTLHDAPLPPSQPLGPPSPLTLSVSQAKLLTNPSTSLPVTVGPVPFNTQQAQAVSSPPALLDPEVAQMLKDELEGASEQQREIWADALQGLSPGDAAGIILMWKKFGQHRVGAGVGHLIVPPPMLEPSHPDTGPTPLNAHAPQHGLHTSPAVDTDLGLRITQHNLANRETCGYLEMLPVFQEVAFDPKRRSEHAHVMGYRLKITPGRLVETGNPAHVAVQRECFFAVQLPTGEEQYTRVGRLVLDAERRLCLDLGDHDYPITPEIKLPEGETRFTVQNGQLRVAVDGQAESVPVGSLKVAEFFDASRLLPLGNCLYGATTASGRPKWVAAELVFQTLEYPLIEGLSALAESHESGLTPVSSSPGE